MSVDSLPEGVKVFNEWLALRMERLCVKVKSQIRSLDGEATPDESVRNLALLDLHVAAQPKVQPFLNTLQKLEARREEASRQPFKLSDIANAFIVLQMIHDDSHLTIQFTSQMVPALSGAADDFMKFYNYILHNYGTVDAVLTSARAHESGWSHTDRECLQNIHTTLRGFNMGF